MIRAGEFEVVPLRDAEGSFATLRESFGADSDEPWERQGWLPERLAAAGVRPDAVELVVLTHLHVDHLGWNSLFERARLVANRVGYEHFERTRGDTDYFQRQVAGRIRRAGDAFAWEPVA